MVYSGGMEAHQFDHAIAERQPYFHDTPPTIEWWCLSLAGEAGELANQAKKIWRDDRGIVTDQRRAKLLDELGDVLAYASSLAAALSSSLSNVMEANCVKIDGRILNGTTRGSGDDR